MKSLTQPKSKAVWIVGGGLLIALAIVWLAPQSSKPPTAKPTPPNAAPVAETATLEGQSMETTKTASLPDAEMLEGQESAAQAFLRRVYEATDPRNIAARNAAREENLDVIEARINAEVLAETGVDLDNSLTLEEKLQMQLQMSREEWEEYQRKPDREMEAIKLALIKMTEAFRADFPEGKDNSYGELVDLFREGVKRAKKSQRYWQEFYAESERYDEEMTSWMTPAQKERHAQEIEQWRKAQLKEAIKILQQGGKPPLGRGGGSHPRKQNTKTAYCSPKHTLTQSKQSNPSSLNKPTLSESWLSFC